MFLHFQDRNNNRTAVAAGAIVFIQDSGDQNECIIYTQHGYIELGTAYAEVTAAAKAARPSPWIECTTTGSFQIKTCVVAEAITHVIERGDSCAIFHNAHGGRALSVVESYDQVTADVT